MFNLYKIGKSFLINILHLAIQLIITLKQSSNKIYVKGFSIGTTMGAKHQILFSKSVLRFAHSIFDVWWPNLSQAVQ